MTLEPLPPDVSALDVPAVAPVCEGCKKPEGLCVCALVEPYNNRVQLVILQHPQEKDELLGTARLTMRHLARSKLRVGLSWAGLAHAVDGPADPDRWAILYPGAGAAEAFPAGQEIALIDSKGAALPNQGRLLSQLEGVIVLDGSWSQAKTLWWRNPWVVRTRRLALNPKQPSLYGKLRREPRRESLSTLEAAALAMGRLEPNPQLEKTMQSNFRRFLQRYRDQVATPAATASAKAKLGRRRPVEADRATTEPGEA